MAYIDRDDSDKIIGVYARKQYPDQELISDDDPEVVVYLNPLPPPNPYNELLDALDEFVTDSTRIRLDILLTKKIG